MVDFSNMMLYNKIKLCREAVFNMSKIKKDFQKYVGEEDRQKQIITDLKEKLNTATSTLKEIQVRKRDVGLQYYTKEKRKEIIKKAEEMGYSAEEIMLMKRFLEDEHWNQDEVTIEMGIIEHFQHAENFIKTNTFSPSILANFLSSLGKLSSENEGGDQNDN